MPLRPVEILGEVYRGWADGDFHSAVEVFDPHVVMVLRPEFPDAGPYLGPAGVRRYTRLFLEPWTRATIEAEEMIEAGDSVVVAVHQRGVGGESGIGAEMRYFHVWTFRGGRAIRLECVMEREEALASVGPTPRR